MIAKNFGYPKEVIARRFWSKVQPVASGCWEWQGRRSANGYGTMAVKPESRPLHLMRAHRIAWTLLYGPISGRLVIDHLCRNRLCVRPTHLDLVTEQENGRRAKSPR